MKRKEESKQEIVKGKASKAGKSGGRESSQ